MGALKSTITPRLTCYGCFRPQGLCYCDTLRPVKNRTRIVIVQHPRETFHPLNTARIAEGCLTNVAVVRGSVEELDGHLKRLPLPARSALLFPSPDAVDLESLAPDERPECVVVLDGTWHHARALRRDCQSLAHLPKVRFTPPAPSEYRIRREPQADYLSTVESIAHALEQLEPDTPHIAELRASFRTMIDRAVSARSRAPDSGRSKRPRLSLRREAPPALALPETQLIVAYAEPSADVSGAGSYPLIVTARRQGRSDPPLRLLLATPTPPHPRLLEHLAVEPDELAAALSLEQARALWQATLKPDDLVASWSRSTLAVLEEAGLGVPQSAQLKELYCNREARRGVRVRGGLDDLLRREGVELPAPNSEAPRSSAPGGRAFERLRQTEAMLHWMRSETHRDHDPF